MIHSQFFHLVADLLAELAHGNEVFTLLAGGVADVGDGMAEEVGDRHPGDGRRILERQKNSGLGPLIRFQGQDVRAVDRDRAAQHLVVGVSHQSIAQGTFPPSRWGP